MTSKSFCDVITFFSNVNFNKSIIQILRPIALYHLAFVSLEKVLSCVSLLGLRSEKLSPPK